MASRPPSGTSTLESWQRMLDQRIISIVQNMFGRPSPNTSTITWNIDGGGQALVPGVQLWTQVDFGFIVTGVTVSTTASDPGLLAAIQAGGVAAFDIFEVAPVDPLMSGIDWATLGQNALFSMIGAGVDIPTLSASLYQSLPLPNPLDGTPGTLNWDAPTFQAGDMLAVSVRDTPAPALITKVNLTLRVRKASP